MPRVSSLSIVLLLIVPIFTGPLLLPAEALAQDEVLSQAAISEYTAKLADAQEFQAEITSRVACLDARDAWLSERRNSLEAAIGDLRRREKPLVTELSIRQEQQQGFRAAYDSELSNHNALQKELRHHQAQKRAQEEAVRQCQRTLSTNGWFDWFTNPSCDLANSIAHLVGILDSVEGRIVAAEKRLQIAEQGIRSAEQRLAESRRALGLTQEQSTRLQMSIRQTEVEIDQLKSTLSDLRTHLQSYKNLLDDFANALKEARSLDTAEARRQTARRIARISASLDTAVAQSRATVNRSNSILPQGWSQSCSTR